MEPANLERRHCYFKGKISTLNQGNILALYDIYLTYCGTP
jgi:hypothetical protein